MWNIVVSGGVMGCWDIFSEFKFDSIKEICVIEKEGEDQSWEEYLRYCYVY